MVRTLVLVAAGGAVGAMGRYLVMVAVGALGATGFPLATLIVNVVGSFVLGALVEAGALVFTLGPDLRALVVVGLLGAFTTFSTFSMETVLLAERQQWGEAALYVVLSVVLSIGAFVLAMRLVRWLAA